MDRNEMEPSSEPKRDSQHSISYFRWIAEQLTVLEEAFDVVMSAERKKVYLENLGELPRERLQVAFVRAARELKFFPKIAELRELAGATDGRLGPEEAWALCPRSEDATVVWTPEIARAFHGGARTLLAEGETTHIVADVQMRKTTLPEKYMSAFREAMGK